MICLFEILLIAGFSCFLIGIFYLPNIKTDLNLADEGYLWYGTLKVLEGKVPIRDFRAYDPGRYYWCALWMLILGQNLISLRICLMIIQILTLTVGMGAVYGVTYDSFSALLMGPAILAWLYPLHKQVDTLFSMTTPFMAILLIGNPVCLQYVISGVYVSICLFFGLNHGIYAGATFLLLIILLGLAGLEVSWLEVVSAYSIGLGLSILPIIALFLLVTGLFNAYWQQKISRILKRGTANLPLPTPWLWAKNIAHLSQLNTGTQWMVKGLFTMMPTIYITTFLAVVFGFVDSTPQVWMMVAVASSGILYFHHAFSRADLSHLSQAIAPFVLLLVIFSANFIYGWIIIVLFIALSFKYVYWNHAFGLKHYLKITVLEKINSEEGNIWVEPRKAKYLGSLCYLIKTHSKIGDKILLLPNLVTLYPLLKREPAIYDVFCIYPASIEEDSMIIFLSKNTIAFVLINNSRIDMCEALRFSHTHPKFWQYINKEYYLLEDTMGIPPNHYAFIIRTKKSE